MTSINMSQCLAAAIAVAALFSTSAPAAEVGTTAAVNPASFGTPPGRPTRTLTLGTDVFFKELIKNEEAGQTQILFLDESSLTVGPNSELILDEFVYDPAASTGKLEISMATGVLRYVGGKISKQGGVTIRTPVATIGVRGGITMVKHQCASGASCQTQVVCGFGKCGVRYGRNNIGVGATGGSGGGAGSEGEGEEETLDPNTTATVGEDGSISVAPTDSSDVGGTLGALQGGDGGTIDEKTVEDQVASNPDSAPSEGSPTNGTGGTTGGGGTDTGTGGTDVGGDVNDASQDSATDTTVMEALEFSVAGRYQSTPAAPFDTDDSGAVADPFAGNFVGGDSTATNKGFTSAIVNFDTSQILIDFDSNGSVDLILPISATDTEFNVVNLNTPDGIVSGTGFVSSDGTFFYYDLGNGTDTTVFIHGGQTPSDLAAQTTDGSISAFDLRPDPNLSVNVPMLPKVLGDQFPNAQVSQFYIANQNGGAVGDSFPFNSGTLWAAFGIEGQGAAQKSFLLVSDGSLWGPSGSDSIGLTQGVRGIVRTDATSPAGLFLVAGSVSSIPDGADNHAFGPDGAATNFVIDNNDAIFATDTDPNDVDDIAEFTNFVQPFNNLSNFTLNGFRHVATVDEGFVPGMRVAGPTTKNGYFAGMGTSRIGPGNIQGPYLIINENDLPTDFVVSIDPASNGVMFDASFSQDSAGNTGVNDGRMVFGGPAGAFRGSYIDDHTFGARNQSGGGAPNGDINGTVGDFQQFNIDGYRSGIVEARVVGGGGALEAAFPGITACVCAFLNWGYWAADFIWDSGGPQAGRRERFDVGTWVAGILSIEANLPASGVATLSGHVIANVYNNITAGGAQYIEAADFDGSWNFGSRTGTFTITGFDGANYNGNIAGPGGVNFSGTGATASGPGGQAINVTVDGSFFQTPALAAGQAGGQTVFEDATTGGVNYRAAGTFATDVSPPVPVIP